MGGEVRSFHRNPLPFFTNSDSRGDEWFKESARMKCALSQCVLIGTMKSSNSDNGNPFQKQKRLAYYLLVTTYNNLLLEISQCLSLQIIPSKKTLL